MLPLIYLRSFAHQSKAFKIFNIYLFAISVVLVWMYSLPKFQQTNLHVSHYYFISQFILLSFFYKELLNSKWIYYLGGAILTFIAYQYISDSSLYFRYNAVGIVITHIIIISYALFYMYRSLASSGPFQIVNVGIFIYLLASALIFASGNFSININIPEAVSNTLIEINIYLYLGFQILIFVEWWKNYSVPKIKS